jgi:pyruvate-formate lyase-activating enzyme
MKCQLVSEGIPPGSCLTTTREGQRKQACEVTLRLKENVYDRVIKSIHLSRPEDYLSVYCSGCNHNCAKCHSSEFSKNVNGDWVNNDALAAIAELYAKQVTVQEPKSRATMWHAEELCRHCGSCVIAGVRSKQCPNKLSRNQVVFSPQGFGPARNIVAFTGGDLTCYPQYYAQAAEKIKEASNNKLWVLIETNGYALSRKNLEILKAGGVDSFWLDIKAFDEVIYRKLCGTQNSTVLKALELILEIGFTVEILTLFIPGIVETNQHQNIAHLIADLDPTVPITLLAFFPSYQLDNHRSPSYQEMIQSYYALREEGLKNIRLGNMGVFAKTEEQRKFLFKMRIDG